MAEQMLETTLSYHTPNQQVGPCPDCGGTDRFVVFQEGNYWCRQCGKKGWWLDNKPTKEELEQIRQERKKEQNKLFEYMHHCQVWQEYHSQDNCYDLWTTAGFTTDEIDKWGLGVCSSCPTAQDYSSLTIPVFYKGELWDIRHRLLGANNGAKYRSHLPGISPLFFNTDSLYADKDVYVVEGEKKVIKVASVNIKSVIGYPGIEYRNRLTDFLNRKLKPSQRVIFVPDPDSHSQILDSAREVKAKCYIAELWMKPDDLIIEFGSSAFIEAISIVRPI